MLVVDREPRNVELLEMLLRQTGCGHVRGTTDSSQVVSLCASWRPHAILLDLAMPDPDGYQLLEELGPWTDSSRVPVLVFSDGRDPGARRRAVVLGARDFLAKPVDLAEVLLRLRTQLELRALRLQLEHKVDEGPPMREGEADPGALRRPVLSLQDAADALGVSASTLRRWADGGRIEAIRTQGGHRRFDPDDLRRLKAQLGDTRRPVVRPASPPARPLRSVAQALGTEGATITRAAVRALYRGGEAGWFASPQGETALYQWLTATRLAVADALYDDAILATRALVQRAAIGGATLLECHKFLGYFHAALVRVLTTRGADQEETAGAHRLMASFEDRLLDEHDAELPHPAPARA